MWGVASRICSRQHEDFLCSYHLAFSSMCFVHIHVVHPYSSIDTDSLEEILLYFIRSHFHMIDNLSIAFHTYARCMLTPLSVDEMPKYLNWFTNFKGLPLKVETDPFCIKQMNCFICIHLEANAFCCLF